MNRFVVHYYDQFVQNLLSANLANLAIIHVLTMSAGVRSYLLQNQAAGVEADQIYEQRRQRYPNLLSCIRTWRYFSRQGSEAFFDQLLQMLRRNLQLYMALGGCQCTPAANNVLLHYLSDALDSDNPVHVEATARILNQPVIVQALSVFVFYIYRHLNKEMVVPYLQALLQQSVPVLSGGNAFTQAASWAFQGLHVIEVQHPVHPILETGVSGLVADQGAATILTMHLHQLVQTFAPGELSAANEDNALGLIQAFLARFVRENLASKPKKTNTQHQQ